MNPFKQRFAYSNRFRIDGETIEDYTNDQTGKPVFTGGDLQAWINNIKVGNLESITMSISVEVAGNYVMGKRDAVLYSTGKRVLVGSLVFSQYDRHALLEQVFQLSKHNINNVSDLWTPDVDGDALIEEDAAVVVPAGVGSSSLNDHYIRDDYNLNILGANGLSREEFNNQLRDQLQQTAQLVGARKFNYSDQIPPFDLTLTGVTQAGQGASCSIFGIQITQETYGFSQNDLGNAVGLSFVALAASPWRATETVEGHTTIPGV